MYIYMYMYMYVHLNVHVCAWLVLLHYTYTMPYVLIMGVLCVAPPTQVEERLMRRLSLAILSWTECLKGVASDSSIDTSMDTTPASSQPQHKLGGTPELVVSMVL